MPVLRHYYQAVQAHAIKDAGSFLCLANCYGGADFTDKRVAKVG